MFRSCSDTIRTPVNEITSSSTGYTNYCDLCKEGGWNTEADLNIHRKKKHRMELTNMLRKGKTMCPICLRKQKNKTALIKHIKIHHFLSSPDSIRIEREIFFCDICNNLFFNKHLLTAHMLHKHILTKEQKRKAQIECPKCFKHIRVKTLWFHFLHHEIFSVSTCPICLKHLEHSELLIDHVKTHPSYYNCTICGYDTCKEQYFNSHVRSHRKLARSAELGDVYRYFLPGKQLRPWNLKILNHFKGLPMTQHLQICILCRQMCSDYDDMAAHIYGDHREDSEVQIKKPMCVCGEVFFNNVMLKHHIFKRKEGHRVLEENETVTVTSDELFCEVVEILDSNADHNSEEISMVLRVHRSDESDS